MTKTSVEGFRFEVKELGSTNPNIWLATVRIQSMDWVAQSFSTCRVPLRWDEGPSRSGFPVSEKSLVSLESDPSAFTQIRKITCFQFQGWTLKLRSVRCYTQPAGFEIYLSVTWILDPGYYSFLKCSYVIGQKQTDDQLGWIKVGRPKTEVPNFLTSKEASAVHACRLPRCRTNGEEGLQPPLSALTVQVESVRSLLDPKSREDATPDFEGATVVTWKMIFPPFFVASQTVDGEKNIPEKQTPLFGWCYKPGK